MFRRQISIVILMTIALTLVSAAQEQVGPGPAPVIVREREYAEMLRARAREAQELAERLYREADGLDRLANGVESLRTDPGQRELIEAKGRIMRLREEAAHAGAEGRLEQSQRLRDEAENIETKLMREREVRRTAANLGAMKQKAATLRQQSMQAKEEGRHEEARELGEKAERVEQDVQAGLEKIERFKIASQIKDRRLMAERAEKRGEFDRAKALFDESRRLEEELGGRPPRDGDLIRAVEELKAEVKELRRQLDEVRAQQSRSGVM